MSRTVCLIAGDGIGPEVTTATRRILDAVGAEIEWLELPAGAAAAERYGDALPPQTLEAIGEHRLALKGPLTTPVGGGFASLNVRLRKTFDLYAAIRPARSIAGIRTRFENVEIIVIRENTEGLYSGLEHEVIPGVVESLKITTRKGCERIARFAFEYARDRGRRKVSVFHKANIMKLSDGLFLDCARKMHREHGTGVEYEELIIDAGCMQLVRDPTRFDMLLLENYNGDVVSDLCAGLVGGLGVIPGANIGLDCAIFEAVHGSAPDIAGQNKANPLALLMSGVMLLRHIGRDDCASRIREAYDAVLSAGDPALVTPDIGGTGGTREFTEAILGPVVIRRFARLAALNVLANLTVPLTGLVDTAMLGRLDEIRFLAGVALASVLFDLIYWSFGFLRMGTTGTTAQAIGRGERAEAYHVLYRGIVVAAAIGTALLLIAVPLREVGFLLLAGEAGVEQAGRDYFNARIGGAPAALTVFVFLGWYLGREESRQALWITAAGNLTNVALNWVFIVRLGLAARGAGLATMCSQYVMLVVALALFFGRGRARIVPWRWPAVLDRARLAESFRLSRDILVRTLCLVGSFALFVNCSSWLGTAFLAANSILLRLLSLAAYLIDGAAFAAESLAGLFRGRQDTAALGRLLRLALASGLVFAGLFLAALFVAPRGVVGLLTDHGEVIDIAVRFAPWLVPTLLFGALAYMFDGLFLGMTEGGTLRNMMLLSTLVVFAPLAGAALAREDNHLLWAALALFMVARTATLAWSWRGLIRRIAREPQPHATVR